MPQGAKTYENIRAYTDQVPTVFVSENLRDQPQSYVTVDNSRGTYIGTRYLYELGHRDILYFGRRHTTTHQLRAEGYMRACQELGLQQRFFNSEFHQQRLSDGKGALLQANRLHRGLRLHGFPRTGLYAGGGRAADRYSRAAEPHWF